jgi:hypothetical protein
MGQSQHSMVLGVDGMPIVLYFEPGSDRMNATGKHIVRGLYFVERKPLLPSKAVVPS